MKRQCAIVLCGTTAILIALVALAGYYKSEAEQKLALVKLARNFHVKLTEEDAAVLVKAQPILERMSHNDYIVNSFWPTLQNWETTPIEWKKAKELILKGRITKVFIPHSLKIFIQERNGQGYTSTAPSGAEFDEAIKQVDPMRVFIQYTLE